MKNEPLIYDYVIVDTKLVAYQAGFHRHKHVSELFKQVVNALSYNNIYFNKILWANDYNKSQYRLAMQPDYKGHRETRDNETLSTQEKVRKDKFIGDYKNTYYILDYVGRTLQNLESETEADDMFALVRHLKPEANILLFSLDEDWYVNIDEGTVDKPFGQPKGATHLLKYTKNKLVTNKKQVEELYGLSGDLLLDKNALCGQKKDSIHGIIGLGTKRFKKYLENIPKDEWFDILEGFISENKFGMKVDPISKHKSVKDMYHHNLLMMSPMPFDKHKPEDVKYAISAIDGETSCSQSDAKCFEEFMLKAVEIYSGALPNLTFSDFQFLRNGNT